MTGVIDLDAVAFARLMTKLNPSGDAWPEEDDAVMQQAQLALAPVFAELNARANNLVIDAFPATSIELLPEWEQSVGLPNHCTPLSSTIQQRQRAVVAKLVARGGSSVAYFIAFAAALGFTISIQQYAPATAGRLRAGQPAYGAGWAFAWTVKTAANTVFQFRAGASAAGEPLQSWGNAQLQCEITSIAPSHTIVQFAYGG